MELRTLRYFLEIARQGNMTRASQTLHVSQPSLSKAMKDLQEELGKPLFIRGSTSLTLTDEGMLLRKRAEDILNIVDKTCDDFKEMNEITGGDVTIGCAESYQIKYLAQAIRRLKMQYPLFHFHLTSGNSEQVLERLDNGIIDFAIIVEPPDLQRYNYIKVPETNHWVCVFNDSDSFKDKEYIMVDDLIGKPIICSMQSWLADIPRWCGERIDELHLSGTINLSYNGTVLIKEGLGYLLTFEQLTNESKENGLCSRPLFPALTSDMYIIWKKYQVFSPIAQLLLNEIDKVINTK